MGHRLPMSPMVHVMRQDCAHSSLFVAAQTSHVADATSTRASCSASRVRSSRPTRVGSLAVPWTTNESPGRPAVRTSMGDL